MMYVALCVFPRTRFSILAKKEAQTFITRYKNKFQYYEGRQKSVVQRTKIYCLRFDV